METLVVNPGGCLQGRVVCPGDKSISHRAVMLGACAEGTTEITGFLEGEDTRATAAAFQALGVRIDQIAPGHLCVHGVGRHGLQPPPGSLDLGNSGTSMRLLAGLLAGQPFAVRLVGDHSLMSRPMRRVVDPLRQMGARIECSSNGTAPLDLLGGADLQGIDYTLPVASAQVKSCLLLAGLSAEGTTKVHEPGPSRDHTERMLRTFGYDVETVPSGVALTGGGRLCGTRIDVPADLSSAAFFLVGAAIAQGSDLVLTNVGINPTRTGILDILASMGALVEVQARRMAGGEPVADLHVRASRLRGCTVPPGLVPLAIDEFPILFIAAACAEGVTTVTGAEELRHKESDRIARMAEGLKALGVEVQTLSDGIRIVGGTLTGGTIDSAGDHRVAMAFAMAGLRAQGPIRITDCSNIRTSFPNFIELAGSSGLRLQNE